MQTKPLNEVAAEETTDSVWTDKDKASLQQHLKEVLEGASFKGSPRGGQFLGHIVERAIAGRFETLKERILGIEVFGRPNSYDTGSDSIVRVTASDVRKRLLQHYGQPGMSSEYRISLPLGSYIPKISREPRSSEVVSKPPTSLPVPPLSVSAPFPSSTQSNEEGLGKFRWIILSLSSIVLILMAWVAVLTYSHSAQRRAVSIQPWTTVFDSQRTTELITSDPNIAEIQGFTGGQISLSDYANHKYIPDSSSLTPEQRRFCTVILRGDKASSVDTPIAVEIAQLAQMMSKKVRVRSARSTELSDLQTDMNLIVLGSPRSNPWTNLFESRLDFKFDYDDASGKEIIRNVHPRAGELSSYVATAPGWATGQSFAIVAFIQNPDENRQVVLLAGENGEGTEAAGKLVTDVPRFASVLKKCGIAPRGPQRQFEILLHLNTMAGTPSDVDVAACHIL